MQVQEYRPPAPPELTPPPPEFTPPPAVTPVPPTPPSREPHSRLGGIVVSVAVLATGVLGVIDLAGAAIAGSAYLALPLAIVGIGLVVGAWYGRARWLIAIGVVLSVILGIVTLVERLDAGSSSVNWRPAGIDQLDHRYKIDLGNAVLDLSAVDFTGRTESVDVSVSIGDLTVIVPENVDVSAEATVDVGNANVFGNQWSGIGQPTHSVTDNGADGVGGGALTIRASVDVGDLEVRR